MWVKNLLGSRTATLRNGPWTLTSRPAPDDSMTDTLSPAATDRNMPGHRGSWGQGCPCGHLAVTPEPQDAWAGTHGLRGRGGHPQGPACYDTPPPRAVDLRCPGPKGSPHTRAMRGGGLSALTP